MMVFFGVGFLRPKWSTIRVACIAMAFSTAIEFSQVYHAPWIDSIRSHTLGHLVLGSGFAGEDLLAYLVGIVIGAGVDHVISQRRGESGGT